MKVVIVGAGIAGLVVGLACQRAGIDVKIYEKANKLANIGGGILLWPHGLRYLDDLDLLECLQSVSMSARRMNIVGHRGQAILSEDHEVLYGQLDGEILPIDRSELQQRLLTLLGDDVLTLGKECIAVSNQPDSVRLSFADGENVHADLVIGADGIHSAVRATVNPKAEPIYTGFCWWGGIVDRAYVPHFPRDEVQFILGKNKICSIWPTHGDRFMWYLPVKMPLEDYSRERDSQIEAQEVCRDWHPDVIKIITAPQNAQHFYLPIYELARDAPTTFGRVVLIGDAACASGPLLGQGANKAIEDAYVLAKLIGHRPANIVETLQRYDVLRYPRHRRFLELEHFSADALMHESIEALDFFEEQLPNINLTMMYQDMIPLVNKAACDELVVEAIE